MSAVKVDPTLIGYSLVQLQVYGKGCVHAGFAAKRFDLDLSPINR